jgi:hypothetical protein
MAAWHFIVNKLGFYEGFSRMSRLFVNKIHCELSWSLKTEFISKPPVILSPSTRSVQAEG